jgi:hypothetical protein
VQRWTPSYQYWSTGLYATQALETQELVAISSHFLQRFFDLVVRIVHKVVVAADAPRR